MAQQTGQVTITGYDTKSGSGQRGPWLMHKFKASDGNEYTTFDATVAQQAQAAGTSPVVLEYTTRQNGQYVNYTLVGVQQAGGAAPAAVAQVAQVAPVAHAPSDKDLKITRMAAQRTAALILGNLDLLDSDVATYRKLVEELVLHAETGRWASSVAPTQKEQDPALPWPDAA